MKNISKAHLINLIDIALNAKEEDYEGDAPVGKALLGLDLFIDELLELQASVKETAADCLLSGEVEYKITLAVVKEDLAAIKLMLGRN